MVGHSTFQLERNGALLQAHAAVCSKLLDSADIVRDGDFTSNYGTKAFSFRITDDSPEASYPLRIDVDQIDLQWDADTSKKVGEPGIGAKAVPERLYFEVRKTIEPLLTSLFEPTKGLILVIQSGINQRKQESRYKPLLRTRLKLLNDP